MEPRGEDKAQGPGVAPPRPEPPVSRSRRCASSARTASEATDTDLSPKALLTRLEQQSGQLGILRSKLDEARQALEQERERVKGRPKALVEERRNRERLEGLLKREQSARKQAEETLDDSRATATALEAQHHLLRAQLKAHEHKSRRGLFSRKR